MFAKTSRVKFVAGMATALVGTALLISACSGGGSSDSPSDSAALVISGGFSGVSLQSLKKPMAKAGDFTTFAATDYTVICAMMVDPFTTGNSALSDDGSFSLSIAGGAGQPIGCMIVKSGKRVADFEFTAAEAGMTGATGGSGLAVNQGATTIQLPTDLSISDAKVSVPVANITQNSSVAPAVVWADPTGTWSITGACETSLNQSGIPVTTCNGAQSADDIPTSVYLKQLQATKNGATKTGLSVWKDSAARTACGDKEGITLDGGWTATGGWAGAMTGGVSMDISDTGKLDALTVKAKVRTHPDHQNNMTAVCGKTTKTVAAGGGAIVSGTTLCSEVDFAGGGWGMSEDACKLYCVMGALSNGGDNPDFDWGAATCKKRYRVFWENNNELATDKDYQGPGNTAGVFSAGTCSDTSFDGCRDTGSGKVLFQMEKAQDQFMLGELFIIGNVGTVMENHHFNSTFPNADRTGTITCGGTYIDKMTMTQISATTASVTVENNFVADLSNPAECATNEHFSKNSDEERSMTLKLVKQ
ncbi:hypothetical protein [Bdellovibrio bacteriovorus]|uniref:hypothetical protein n=1 Tax=Bdellovibrio bacteriovorus TaxID=959 RepID=UPI00045C1882|nr:hypothetical protein [Bdellovibrio bacteriovorus]AHZ86771.1 hypothetical protein EP01_17785 [Bdellovibrio bacteriovorus]BEV67211.1 hypothetical protein Bb109J_c0631 [Bdellovibrio bacteriovorus]